ncbi:hypothetical protein [Sorangium sp. So ce1389]|uniref:hypothetical protein n=1 Tax=Sorangium sp. So ce1389 TaxID=3133336 RepID=UPI003F61D88E
MNVARGSTITIGLRLFVAACGSEPGSPSQAGSGGSGDPGTDGSTATGGNTASTGTGGAGAILGAYAVYLARFVEEHGKEDIDIEAVYPQNEPRPLG